MIENTEIEAVLENYFKKQVFLSLNMVRLGKLCDKEILKHMHMVSFQSGKLVTKMFQKIQELIDDKDALVFVLIDEV